MALKKPFYTRLGTTLWVFAAIFALLPSWPHFYYRLNADASNNLATTIANTAKQTPEKPINNPTLTPTPPQEEAPPKPKPTPTVSLPPLDLSLPTENGLIIEKIGVKGEIHEGENWESILRQGIWRVPDFSTPLSIEDSLSETKKPIILAAHRWGYLEWSAGFRKLNSFYNLPKLQEGDKIEIIWEQRKYEYEVYSLQTGTEIPEYNTDLILYTCQLWNSPVRFFVFAKRIN